MKAISIYATESQGGKEVYQGDEVVALGRWTPIGIRDPGEDENYIKCYAWSGMKRRTFETKLGHSMDIAYCLGTRTDYIFHPEQEEDEEAGGRDIQAARHLSRDHIHIYGEILEEEVYENREGREEGRVRINKMISEDDMPEIFWRKLNMSFDAPLHLGYPNISDIEAVSQKKWTG